MAIKGNFRTFHFCDIPSASTFRARYMTLIVPFIKNQVALEPQARDSEPRDKRWKELLLGGAYIMCNIRNGGFSYYKIWKLIYVSGQGHFQNERNGSLLPVSPTQPEKGQTLRLKLR